MTSDVRRFFWADTEYTSLGKCKVAWTSICRPMSLGGLSVLDLWFFGFAVRLH